MSSQLEQMRKALKKKKIQMTPTKKNDEDEKDSDKLHSSSLEPEKSAIVPSSSERQQSKSSCFRLDNIDNAFPSSKSNEGYPQHSLIPNQSPSINQSIPVAMAKKSLEASPKDRAKQPAKSLLNFFVQKQKVTEKMNESKGKTQVHPKPSIEILPLNLTLPVPSPPPPQPTSTQKIRPTSANSLKPPILPPPPQQPNLQAPAITNLNNRTLSVDQNPNQKQKNSEIKTVKIVLKETEMIKKALGHLQSALQGLEYIQKRVKYDRKFREKIKSKVHILREIFGAEDI